MSFVQTPRKIRASVSYLPAGPIGVVLGNTMRVELGMRNVVGTGLQARAPYSAHTTTGEDSSRPTSEHWAITQESASQSRATFDAFRSSHPSLTYRQCVDALQTLQSDALHAEALRQAEALRIAARKHRSKGARRNPRNRMTGSARSLETLAVAVLSFSDVPTTGRRAND